MKTVRRYYIFHPTEDKVLSIFEGELFFCDDIFNLTVRAFNSFEGAQEYINWNDLDAGLNDYNLTKDQLIIKPVLLTAHI